MSTALRTYYRGHRLAVMRNGLTSQNAYYHFDHQGTTQCLSDSAGAVTDRFASDTWGMPVKRTGSSINRQWYVGDLGYYAQAAAGFLCAHATLTASLPGHTELIFRRP